MTKFRWVRGAVMVAVLAGGGASVAFMGPRQPVTAPAEAPWVTRIKVVEGALERRDVSAAIHVWRDAYGEAARSRRWDALLAVGDAAMQIDRASRDGEAFKAPARRAYLESLFRARSLGSEEGIRRAAAAFADLGDTEMAEHARAMASSSPAPRAER